MPIHKFTNEETTKFIKLYQAHPCLWQSDTGAYRNKAERKKAIDEIVAEMNIPGFKFSDCQIKIKNVRSHYLQELKKIYDSNFRGVRKVDKYTPTLSWFNLIDSFLWNYVIHQSPKLLYLKRHRDIQENGIMESCEDIKKEDIDMNDGEETTMHSWNGENVHHDGEDFSTACNPMLYEESEQTFAIPFNSRRLSDRENGVCSTQMETARQYEAFESEFDIFGKGVAAQLKGMPLIEAVQLQLKIQQLITEHRLRIFMAPNSIMESVDHETLNIS